MRPESGGGGGVAAGLMAGGGRPLSPWRTPTPYLFLVFGFMMGLIIVVLLVLTCTRRRSSRRRDAGEEKPASVRGVLLPLDREAPRVVVIMAGDLAPSFLASAKPLAVAAHGGAGVPDEAAAAV